MASRLALPRELLFAAPVVLVLLSQIFKWPPQIYLTTTPPFLNSLSDVPYVTSERTDVTYYGTSANGVDQFQNIFYAEDTSGANRFAPPLPYMPPPGTIVDATTSGAACPQGVGPGPFPFVSAVTNVSENCLSLRIARPASIHASGKLPVMVWIHGGASVLGTASDQLYRPEGLVQQSIANSQPVIFVSMNYRLGIFGFATNKAIRDEKQANVGLRDQRAAFEWVQNNIEAFGGDPDKITAFGQSVGASAIGSHLVSYRGKKGVPFKKAIMMSGATGYNLNIMSDTVAQNTATVAKSLGCIKDNPDSYATIACLREVPLDKLLNVSVSLSQEQRPPFGEFTFNPTIDDDYIPDRPSVLLQKGDFVKDIPIIASWVTNDGAWYAPPTVNDDASVLAAISTVTVGLSESSSKRFLSLYPVSDFNAMVGPEDTVTAQYYRAAQILRDILFTCPVVDYTWRYAKHGGSASTNIRLFEMNQTRFEPIWKYIGISHWRVGHLSDVPYLLNGDIAGGGDNGPSQQQLASMVSGSAAAFAHTGDPSDSTGSILQDWPIAYGNEANSFKADWPNKTTVYLIGGPHGSGPASIASNTEKKEHSAREKAIGEAKFLQRCEFISSIQDEIGV